MLIAMAAAATSEDWVGIPGLEPEVEVVGNLVEGFSFRKGAEGDREGRGPGVGVADADPGFEVEWAGRLP